MEQRERKFCGVQRKFECNNKAGKLIFYIITQYRKRVSGKLMFLTNFIVIIFILL